MSATCPVCATPVAADAAYCHACGATQPARCLACGTARVGGSAFCPECGAALPALPANATPGAAPNTRPIAPDALPDGPANPARPFADAAGLATAAPSWGSADAPGGGADVAPGFGATPFRYPIEAIRQRPSWMAAALVFVTFGLYWPIWFGQTWSEMKRVVRDPGMSPFWHALTPLVPIYGLFRTHAHFRVVAALLGPNGAPIAVPPRLAVVLALVSGVLGVIAFRPGVSAGEFVLLMLGASAALARLAGRGQAALNALWRQEFGAASRPGALWGEWLALVVCGLVFALFVLGGLVG